MMAQLAIGQGTAFLYQGQLDNGGAAANGGYNFKFTLYSAQTNGAPVSGSLTNYNVAVNNGLFTTTLDFGQGIFTGPNLWLQIGVCTNNETNFTFLQPLQPVLPTPYAIFANSASNLVGQLAAAQLTGTLPASAFAGYTNTVALTNGANLFAGEFTGNGAGVTNVSVTNLVGVLADSQLPANTAYLNSNQTFTANNTFNGANTFTNLYQNSFSGSFFGNGLVGWIVVPGTSTNASIDTGYLLTNSQSVTVTLPTTAHVGDIVRIACAGAGGWQLAQMTGQSVIGNFLSYGQTWYQSQAAAEDWTSIASSSDGAKMVATSSAVSSGNVWVSANSGQTWTSTGPNSALWQAAASSADGTKLFAAVHSGFIYYSTNSGSSWTSFGVGANWTSLACSSDGARLVAGTSNGGLSNFVNQVYIGGASAPNPVTALASSASGSNLIAATFGGSLYTYASGHWASAGGTGGSSAKWNAVGSSADGSRLAAAVSNGLVYVSSNFGSSWTTTAAPSLSWVSLASSSDGSKLVAAAAKGGLYTSSNWGAAWMLQTNQNASAGASWSAVTSSSSGSVLAAAINNTLGGPYGIFTCQAATQTQTTAGTGGYLLGAQGSAAELQCVGNNEWMPVSSSGTLWAQ
ncbi:MAG TPA: hypothetical protein VGY98_13325 [Verrucomicrobiae bacterium]|nr:hypothetical protein [Verrucomicrobiae bacterium]